METLPFPDYFNSQLNNINSYLCFQASQAFLSIRSQSSYNDLQGGLRGASAFSPPWSLKTSDFPSCSFCSRHTGLLAFLPWMRVGGGGALLPQGLCMCLECPPRFYPTSQIHGLLPRPSCLLWGHLPSLPIDFRPPHSIFFFCLFFSIAVVIT